MSSAAAPARLDARLRQGTLGNDPIRLLARWLADVHARSRPSRGAGPAALTQDLGERVRRLTGRVSEPDRAALREVAEAQRDFLARHADRLREREHAGRVRALAAPPPRLAELLLVREEGEERVVQEPGARGEPARDAPRDVCADAAGLALELVCGGRGDLAERLLSAYAGCAHDFDLYEVADFHERERALALAELELALSGEAAEDAARRLVLAALATRRRPLLPPVVVAVGGQVARGKSTVSRALAERLGAPRVEADRVRDALLEVEPGREDGVHEIDWERAFAPEFGERVYAELLRCAAVVLSSGRPIVLDACFPRAFQRARARELARREGYPFLFVECRADDAVVEARLAERAGAGWPELAKRLAEHWEPAGDLPPEERAVLRTDGALDLGPVEARLPAWPEGLPE